MSSRARDSSDVSMRPIYAVKRGVEVWRMSRVWPGWWRMSCRARDSSNQDASNLRIGGRFRSVKHEQGVEGVAKVVADELVRATLLSAISMRPVCAVWPV
eukprot:365392-Chlamydomonas_euryale.AAC.3